MKILRVISWVMILLIPFLLLVVALQRNTLMDWAVAAMVFGLAGSCLVEQIAKGKDGE